jgi:hypothetical protein
MTAYKSEALTLSVYRPLVQGGEYLFDWRTSVESWRHETRAMGGYWSATSTQADNLTRAEEWLADGLGRHVEVHDEALNLVWEGFVDSVSIDVGGLNVTRGPLLNVANKVKLLYSTIDTSDGGFGARASTAYAEDATSQARYGVIHKILSAGGLSQTNAEQIRDTYLAQNKTPETTSRFTLAGQDNVRLSIELLGYVHMQTIYPFASSTTGNGNLSTRLAAILDDDPNGLFSSANASIATNTVQVSQWEDDDPMAWEAIKGLVAMGDANDARYLYGVYGGRRVVYEAAPAAYTYRREIAAQGDIETIVGGTVKPWAVKPGRWLLFPDFLVGRSQPSDLRQDPRAMFIERVVFSLPRGLQLDGSKVSTVEQKIARLGLMGIGA